MVEFEECFGSWHNAPVVCRATPYGQGAPMRQRACNAAHEIGRVGPASLIETAGGAGSPVRSPSRDQAHPLIAIRVPKAKQVVVCPEPQLVLRRLLDRKQPRA